MNQAPQPVGTLLREWRQRRRMTQLDLALEAEISARHLSFVETGRAQPSREMLTHLSEQLDIPLRERNVLFVAAGYAPLFPARGLDDPALHAVRSAIDIVLQAQRPYPAFALDRHWNMAASNGALPALYDAVQPELLAPPVNALRLSLHPQGLAPKIVNLAEWRAHLIARLRRQIQLTADRDLLELLRETEGYPAPPGPRVARHSVMVPLQIRAGDALLSFFTATTVFGTPVDVTLSELSLELFFPADTTTAAAVKSSANR